MLPKVAIICANYNYGDYIVAAMESVAKQTYQGELSLYVVDDGSSDDSWEKISNYYESQKEKISIPTTPPWLYIKRIENSGASIARNTAIEMCWGWADIIGVLDSDDEYYPEKVERLVSKLVEHDEVGVAYTDYDIQTPTHCKREFKNSFNRQTLMERCIVHSNSLIKTKYLRQPKKTQQRKKTPAGKKKISGAQDRLMHKYRSFFKRKREGGERTGEMYHVCERDRACEGEWGGKPTRQ